MRKHTLLYYTQKYLLSGVRLTHLFFQERHGSWRLAVSIHTLSKKYGWKIDRHWVRNSETNCDIAVYSLSDEERNRLAREGLTTEKFTAQELKGGE